MKNLILFILFFVAVKAHGQNNGQNIGTVKSLINTPFHTIIQTEPEKVMIKYDTMLIKYKYSIYVIENNKITGYSVLVTKNEKIQIRKDLNQNEIKVVNNIIKARKMAAMRRATR